MCCRAGAQEDVFDLAEEGGEAVVGEEQGPVDGGNLFG